MASIHFQDVRKSYGATQVVHGITLTVANGEFVVLVGPSGCGKSTLLRMVAGLEEISAGTISIGDRVVNDLEPKDRDCAMVFQNYALYPHMSVYENMAYGLRIRKLPKADIERRVNEAAAILELDQLLTRKPRQLSGGQRQRVAMGRAIVREPAAFLFDEPLSNLDAKLRVQTRLAQRMIVMNAGRAEQVGTPDDVYSRPATTFVASFIGSPPMNLLEGRVSSDGRSFIASDGTQIELPAAAAALAGRSLVLGLRPEHLHPGGDRLAMVVETVEVLGAEHLIHGKVAGHDVIVRSSPQDHPAPGALLPLGFAASAVHWFDATTRQRIAG
jgi:sn-glycerol 3-phosphate transport system ATP-binding protein